MASRNSAVYSSDVDEKTRTVQAAVGLAAAGLDRDAFARPASGLGMPRVTEAGSRWTPVLEIAAGPAAAGRGRRAPAARRKDCWKSGWRGQPSGAPTKLAVCRPLFHRRRSSGRRRGFTLPQIIPVNAGSSLPAYPTDCIIFDTDGTARSAFAVHRYRDWYPMTRSAPRLRRTAARSGDGLMPRNRARALAADKEAGPRRHGTTPKYTTGGRGAAHYGCG